MRELLEERAGASQVIHCLKAVGPHWQSGGEPPYRGRGGKSGGSYAELFNKGRFFSSHFIRYNVVRRKE